MRLYTLNKRQFVLVFVTFFLCFGLSILIGLAGERSFVHRSAVSKRNMAFDLLSISLANMGKHRKIMKQ